MRCACHSASRLVRVVFSIGLCLLLVGQTFGGQPIPAGKSAAVLSFIDAAASRVEIVRHWPSAPEDVDVYPLVPYVWGGCPGSGAILMLVTGVRDVSDLTARITQVLTRPTPVSSGSAQAREIGRIVTALRTPGDPAQEALKAEIPWVSDLPTYERLGYAVFLFIHQQGLRCAITFETIPEGYGIPFVN